MPRIGLRGWARRTRSERLRKIAVRFRALALKMGGVLIKVGQWLSTRLDVLPVEIVSELTDLQDEVSPEDFADLRRVAEAEFGMRLEEKFASFEAEPLAAASIGQAHRATIRVEVDVPADESADTSAAEMAEVVVKIQRPDIERIVNTDLAALRTVGSWLKRYPPIRKRADVPALLAEFTRSLHEEMDYISEGEYAEKFAENFRARPGIRVPYVVWSHTTKRVITLEDVSAIKITDYAEIEAAGVSLPEVAERLFTSYFQQVFADHFFHADPHPGNLFVHPHPNGQTPNGNRDFDLVFVDFGMVGHITPRTRAGLRELLLGVGSKDATRLVQAYKSLGVLLPSADIALLEKASARAFDQFWGKTTAELRDISFEDTQEFAREFSDLLYSMPFQIPEDLIMMGRTSAILSGMCVGLDEGFNVWASIGPFMRDLMAEEMPSVKEIWLEQLSDIAQAVLALPGRTDKLLRKMESGQLAVQIPELTQQTRTLDKALRRVVNAVVFAGLLLGGVQLRLAGETTFGGVLLAFAGLVLLRLVFG